MSVLLFIVVIAVSYLIVRVGSIALKLTGMEKSMARFHALSAFSGTGFTTRDAERIVNHPRRRRIVTHLIILGNAGIVSVIAAFVLTLGGAGVLRPVVNVLLIVLFISILSKVAMHRSFAQRLTDRIRSMLVRRFHFEEGMVEELLQQADGHGVARILLGETSGLAGRSLEESGLRERDLLVLSIERDEGVLPVPRPDVQLRAGDRLVVYGRLEEAERLI